MTNWGGGDTLRISHQKQDETSLIKMLGFRSNGRQHETPLKTHAAMLPRQHRVQPLTRLMRDTSTGDISQYC